MFPSAEEGEAAPARCASRLKGRSEAEETRTGVFEGDDDALEEVFALPLR